MKQRLLNLILCSLAASASASVRVFVEDLNGKAWIKYQCTGGETVRTFALDVTVDKGRIIGVTNFLRGPGTAASNPAALMNSTAVRP